MADVLTDPQSNIYRYLRQPMVRELFEQHASGRHDNHKILFSLVLFENGCARNDSGATMIGVMANPADHGVVREFFELFKTPWELYRPDRRYEVVLCAGEGHVGDVRADLVLIYGGDEVAFDADAKTPVESRRTSTMLSYQGRRMPIYGRCLTFRSERLTLTDEASQQPAAVVLPSGDTVRVRIGYDLFREIGTVLTVGQPPANADIPVVEMHIGLLRDLIVEYAAPLVEILRFRTGIDSLPA